VLKTRVLLEAFVVKVLRVTLLRELCSWLMSFGTWPCRLAAYLLLGSRTLARLYFAAPAKTSAAVSMWETPSWVTPSVRGIGKGGASSPQTFEEMIVAVHDPSSPLPLANTGDTALSMVDQVCRVAL
jgi:hypothetical protein